MPRAIDRSRVAGGLGTPQASVADPSVSTDQRVHSTDAGPITGAVGVEPPPNAPRENTQPLQPDAGARIIPANAALSEKAIEAGYQPGQSLDPIDLARAHERELAPLKFDQTRPVVPDSGEVREPAPVQAAVVQAASAPTPADLAPADLAAAAPEGAATAVIPPIEDLSAMPAASNTDSPSRGVPQQILDPNKRITGGFAIGQPQYFPLDGQELRALVDELLAQVGDRMKNDLRFSIAVCYPRVSARVIVEITGFEAHDAANFEIPAVMHPHEKTAIDVARQHANEICFIVLAEAQEVDEHGDSQIPPDQIRTELGLTVPRKQQVDTGLGGFQLADVVMRPGENH